ncbi:Golgi resident protein GCP60 isoform X3 [Halichoerus grypus]|uniref:Golgi resident protein GCP60 isoform X3 n=1 Tax=Halichoerus grypus TaxID=9711 RepID=UPI001659AF09|nr:Golgi resident protein GCP60 isoform X3 [Halichoerus grypus]
MAAVLNAERLEVSVDGLTLSPDPEERPSAEGAPLVPPPPSPPGAGRGPGAAGKQPDPGEAAAGGAAEEARRLEQRWGFGLEELYGLALRFFKEKDGKAFHPTYEEKLKLVALHKQVLMGPYNPDTCPEVGFFDVLGNDRRREWAALGNMSKEDAMVEFVKLLNRCCHLFSTYVASHKIEKEEQEKKRQQIMAALNSQTAVQFQQYAAQQYPGSLDQQQLLVRQLQEQHYQQYMQQLYQAQLAQQQAALQKQQEVAVAGASLPASSKVNAAAPGDRMSVNGQAKTHTDNPEKELEPEAAEEAVENGPKESLPVIAAPSMWTRPQIKDFKEKIRQDADSVITVGRGEVVTVRVPTHEEGSYLFWEFATDNYDIGFGVYFEWTDSPNTAVSVHVSESSDDDEEEEGRAMENVSSEEKSRKHAAKPLLDEIVPVYRRDCHEEVYAGSHQYPGRGVYLLKFDNSYSLWRSKSVYYRVYYTR